MLTQEQVLHAIKRGRVSECIDRRDYHRLAGFFPTADLNSFSFGISEESEHAPKDWTRENVLAQLAKDVSFGFEKALNKRGISAGLMNSVVRMWMWILDDPLQFDEEYAQYGLPYLKRVAVKYNLPNPIGNHYGNEAIFAQDSEDD